MGNPPVPEEFVRALAPALRQSASIARALEGRVANRPKQDEVSAVKAALTVADTATQEAILVPLLEHFPEVCVRAEEDTPSVHRFPAQGPALVVVDPIDGTLRFYIEALGPYAILVGLAVAQEYRAALLALPREELYFDAVRGEGARAARGDATAAPLRIAPSGNRVLISHDLPAAAVESLLASGFQVAPASGGAISVAPLVPGARAGLRLARESGSGVSIRGRIGALIAAEAGALVACETGAPFPADIDAPARALLVAGSERDMAALHAALGAAGAA
jgi:fructose-1,6-bisphosphatase/inositol monophosphatase family enzyme